MVQMVNVALNFDLKSLYGSRAISDDLSAVRWMVVPRAIGCDAAAFGKRAGLRTTPDSLGWPFDLS